MTDGMRLAAWIAIVVAGLYVLAEYVAPLLVHAGFHYFEEAIGVAVAGSAIAVGAGCLRWGREPPVWAVPVAATVAVLVIYGLATGHEDRSHGFIADYCRYGAVSKAQVDGCLDHVDDEYIEGLNTNAARFARRDLEDCLDDSGPFCLDALEWRLLNDQQ